jgi:hypothetical protein
VVLLNIDSIYDFEFNEVLKNVITSMHESAKQREGQVRSPMGTCDICVEQYEETEVALSDGDVTSNVIRPLATEINQSPLLTIEKCLYNLRTIYYGRKTCIEHC